MNFLIPEHDRDEFYKFEYFTCARKGIQVLGNQMCIDRLCDKK